MHHLGSTATLLACLAMAGVAGCASTDADNRRGMAAIVDDAAITAGVEAALVGDPNLKASEINVETYQGVVQLSGFVGSAESVAAAATVARTVKGVKSVRNDLRLK